MLNTDPATIESSLLMSASRMRESWFVLFGTLLAAALIMLATCSAGPIMRPGALQRDEMSQVRKATSAPVQLAACTAQQNRQALAALPPYVPRSTDDFVQIVRSLAEKQLKLEASLESAK